MKTRWTALIILPALMLAGCTPTEDSGSLEPLSPPQENSSTLTTSPSQEDNSKTELSTPLPDELQILVDKTKADLAQRLSYPETEIKLGTAFEVTWPDSSLGCPQPGTTYTQVLTDGFLFRFEANGEQYEYHTDFGEQFVLCYSLSKENDQNVQDGWPNQTRDKDVIIVTPTPRN